MNPMVFLTQYGTTTAMDTIVDNLDLWNIPNWQAGVRYLAETIAPLRKKIIKDDDGDRIEQRKHSLNRLLNRKCNDYAGPVRTYTTWITHALNYGNGYLRAHRGVLGQPAQLVNMHPRGVAPVRVDGVKYFYDIRTNEILFNHQVLHLMGAVTDDGVLAHDPAFLMQETFGTSKAMQTHTFSYFKNGTSINGALEIPADLKKEQIEMIADAWQQSHGYKNAGGVGVVPLGGKWVNTSQDNQQAQLRELRAAMGQDLLKFLMPVTAITSEKPDTLTLCRPIVEQIEDEMTLKLLSEEEIDNGFCVRVDTVTLKRNDPTQAIAKVNAGLQLPDEVRAEWDLPPIPGGDRPRMPINVAKDAGSATDANGKPLGKSPSEAPPTPAQPAEGTPEVAPPAESGGNALSNLNGAQIAAALEIVKSVAGGELPRDSGIALLKTLFGMSEDQAIELMGSAGKGESTPPQPAPGSYAALAPVLKDVVDRVEAKRTKAVERRQKFAGREGYTAWLTTFANEQGAYLVEALKPLQAAAAAMGKPVEFASVATDYEEAILSGQPLNLMERINARFIQT
jgi:hypothetical protein